MIVKDGMFKREYFVQNGEKAEYREFIWDNDIKKYVPSYNEFFKLDNETWDQFKTRMREKGYLPVEEVKAKGTYR